MPQYVRPVPVPPAKKGAPSPRTGRPRPQQAGPPRGVAWHAIQLKAAQSAAAARGSATRSDLPAPLKAGVEALSGLAMDDVRVHRNSPEPAKLGALAFARGSEIHLGPGQEGHLPHEAWHVVQQKLGRVQATAQMKGALLNDEPALEREADAMAERLVHPLPAGATEPRAAPLWTAGNAAPIQAKFQFVARWFVFNRDKLVEEIANHRELASFFSEQKNIDDVIVKIRDWAVAEADVGFKGSNYTALLKNAAIAVLADRNAARSSTQIGASSSSSSSSSSSLNANATDPRAALALRPEEKIEKLKGLRRVASNASMELMTFRDTSTSQWLTHKDHPTTTYGIASGSNFMLGGRLPDDYAELFVRMKLDTGATDNELARILLDALDGKPIAPRQKEAVTKFVSLVHGPEFRRAAINPLVVRVALRRVEREGGDIFQILQQNVLFFASEPAKQRGQGLGGSKRSQFHREKIVDQTEASFRQVASNEFDALVKAASEQGYDVTDDRKMAEFVTAMARNHVLAHKVIYKGFTPPVASGPVATTRAQGYTGQQIVGMLTVAVVLLALITAYLANARA